MYAQKQPFDTAEPRFFLRSRHKTGVTQDRRKPRAWYVDRQTQVLTLSAIALDLALAALGLWWLVRLCIRIAHWL